MVFLVATIVSFVGRSPMGSSPPHRNVDVPVDSVGRRWVGLGELFVESIDIDGLFVG